MGYRWKSNPQIEHIRWFGDAWTILNGWLHSCKTMSLPSHESPISHYIMLNWYVCCCLNVPHVFSVCFVIHHPPSLFIEGMSGAATNIEQRIVPILWGIRGNEGLASAWGRWKFLHQMLLELKWWCCSCQVPKNVFKHIWLVHRWLATTHTANLTNLTWKFMV